MNECLTSVANHGRTLTYGETWETLSLTYQSYAIRGAIFQHRIENSPVPHLHRVLPFTGGNSRPSRRFSAYQFSEAAEAPSAISTRTNCWTKFPEPVVQAGIFYPSLRRPAAPTRADGLKGNRQNAARSSNLLDRRFETERSNKTWTAGRPCAGTRAAAILLFLRIRLEKQAAQSVGLLSSCRFRDRKV